MLSYDDMGVPHKAMVQTVDTVHLAKDLSIGVCHRLVVKQVHSCSLEPKEDKPPISNYRLL